MLFSIPEEKQIRAILPEMEEKCLQIDNLKQKASQIISEKPELAKKAVKHTLDLVESEIRSEFKLSESIKKETHELEGELVLFSLLKREIKNIRKNSSEYAIIPDLETHTTLESGIFKIYHP